MKQDFDFFKTEMPGSRKADFYLGCLDGSVFMDFNQSRDGLISLCRISFDGYGCCNMPDTTNFLNFEMSKKLIEEITKDKLDQEKLTPLVKEIIKINREYIWTDALDEYNLIDKLSIPSTIQIPMLTDSEINKIFSWQPYREDWPINRNQTEDNIHNYYGDLINRLTQTESFETYYSEDGGLGNYLEFICYPGGRKEHKGNAILVCISLCSPFAVYGQITIYKEQNSFGWGHMFSPDQAYSIADVTLLEIEKQIKQVLKDSKLSLLDKDFLSKQLPNEVVNNLKSENHNGGTQYLHGIFQKTD